MADAGQNNRINPQSGAPDIVRQIGDIEIRALSDGFLPSRVDVARGISLSECERLTGVKKGETLWMHVNEFLLNINGKFALIDTGAADRMYPSLGLMTDNLKAKGVDPSQIESIFITHLHPDHMYGLIGADGAAAFPNAEVFLHELEANFWLKDETSTNEVIEKNRAAALKHVAPYRDRLRIVKDGEAAPGMSILACPGHTPGHSAWIVHSGRDSAMMWGDIVHLQDVQFAHPDVSVFYDLDGEQAARSRRRIFDMCVSDGIATLGAHLAFPGFAQVVRRGDGFAYEMT